MTAPIVMRTLLVVALGVVSAWADPEGAKRPRVYSDALNLSDEIPVLQTSTDADAQKEFRVKLTTLALALDLLSNSTQYKPTPDDCRTLTSKVAPIATRALDDQERGVRPNALRIIVALNGLRAKAGLAPVEGLDDKFRSMLEAESDAETRGLLIRASASAGLLTLRSLEVLASKIESRQQDQGFVQDSFGKIAEQCGVTPGASELLQKYLGHESRTLRRCAIRSLYKCEKAPPDVNSQLLAMLKDPNYPIRQAALFALEGPAIQKGFTEDDLSKVMSEALDSNQDMLIRLGCLTVLAKASQTDQRRIALRGLLKIAQDQNQPKEVRRHAIESFVMVAGLEPDYVKALQGIYEQEGESILGHAAKLVLDRQPQKR